MSEYIDEDSSHAKRILMLVYVITSLIMCGGSVFGFTPLKEILLDEGTYADLCEAGQSLPCEHQLAKLDRMFTLAASLFSAYLLPAGLFLRFIGPRFCFLLGFALVFLGSLGFAKASAEYFTICYVLIGSGNPLLYISAFNFGKLYPESSNLLLSVFIGCFGFSSVIFYFFHVLHFDYNYTSREIFTAFSLIPVILGLVAIFIVPPDPYHLQRKKKLEAHLEAGGFSTEKTPLKAAEGPQASDLEDQNQVDTSQTEALPLKERSIGQQLITPQFIAQTMFFCWGMLHQNFYLGTIGDQIFMLADDDDSMRAMAGLILTKFSILYPIGCIISILPVGALVRNCSVGVSLLVYCVANAIFSGLALIPSVEAQWGTCIVYVIVRVGFFTSMSTYSSTIFGFKNLGSMFGCAGCLAGMASLLGTLLSERALHVDHSFVPVNSVMLIGAGLNFLFPLVILSQKWQKD